MFFVPDNDEKVDPAPFIVAQQPGLPGEPGASESEEEASRAQGRPKRSRAGLADWRKRRSASRIHYGKRTLRVVRLADAKAGFRRRRSPAPGTPQMMRQSRKVDAPVVLTNPVLGSTNSDSDAVRGKARAKVEFRQNSRAMLQASRPKGSAPEPADTPVVHTPSPPLPIPLVLHGWHD